MDTIKDILLQFDPTKDRYISREYQSFGVHLAEKLGDENRKALYIKLAKTIPRPVLEQALRFVVDSTARKKGALFMWKLKELGAFPEKPEKTAKKAEKKAKKEAKKRKRTRTCSRFI
jgi:hypothetical protein